MLVKGAALAGTFAQAAQAVAVSIELHCVGVGVGRMQQTTLFDGEQEDQPVDQTQQLLKIDVAVEPAAGQRITQGLIGGLGQETLAQCNQRFFHALAKLLTGTGALLLAALAPS
ncbi:MAG TPA: hypothetical protein VGC24_06910, partial [Burkholderiaceae bacterium]